MLFETNYGFEYPPSTEHPDVVSVFLNKAMKLQTTRSWDFLGMERNGGLDSIWKKARYGEDTIIGNIDTGNFNFNFF